MKIGIIAGQGKLPHYVLAGANSVGHKTFVIGLKGITKSNMFSDDVKEFGLGELGGVIKYLRELFIDLATGLQVIKTKKVAVGRAIRINITYNS